MRRDYFTLSLRGSEREPPTLRIAFDGPADAKSELESRLRGEDGSLGAESIDVSYRLRSALEDGDATGVLGVTNRVTGGFIIELDAAADEVLPLVREARGDDPDEASYRLAVVSDDEELAHYQKGTFLVYDPDGGLLRQHSLIPSGVEL